MEQIAREEGIYHEQDVSWADQCLNEQYHSGHDAHIYGQNVFKIAIYTGHTHCNTPIIYYSNWNYWDSNEI